MSEEEVEDDGPGQSPETAGDRLEAVPIEPDEEHGGGRLQALPGDVPEAGIEIALDADAGRGTQPDGAIAEGLSDFPRRIAGSDAERRAAGFLAGQVAGAGVKVDTEPITVRPARSASAVLHLAVALVGGLIALALPLLGIAVTLVASASLYLDRIGRTGPLTLLMPKRASQNVIAGSPAPDGPPIERLVLLTAGYDVPASARLPHQPIGAFAALGAFGRMLTPVRISFWGGAVPILACCLARGAGFDGTVTGVVQMIASVILLIGIAILIDRAASGPSGSEAEAGVALSVESAVAAWRELGQETGPETAVWLALLGADECGSQGAARLLGSGRLPVSRRRAVVIDILAPAPAARDPEAPASGAPASGATVSGAPAYTTGEGELLTFPMSSRLGRHAAQAGAVPVATSCSSPASIARSRGVEAISVSAPDSRDSAELAVSLALI